MTDTTQATAAAKSKRDRVATHEWLDRDGNVVEAEEEAYGYRYTLNDVAEPFTWMFEEKKPDAQRMTSLFGTKTLSTNISSGVRNSDKYDGNPESQMAAVIERFALIDAGEWTAPSEGGPAVRIDKDALAEAICRVLVAEGKKSQADIDSGHKAKV